jgi:uncharacterized protein YcbX
MLIGKVAALWRYPVKSLRAENLERVNVLDDGFAGDRTGALMVESEDHARTGKTLRGKESNRLHLVRSAAEGTGIAADLGISVRPATPGRYFDARPISLLFTTWIAEAEALLGRTLDPLRYRPNIVAHAASGFSLGESALVGRTITIGNVILTVTEEIDRCITTTYDVETGERDMNVLRVVAQHRDNVMGVYCTVAHIGTITAGEDIDLGSARE